MSKEVKAPEAQVAETVSFDLTLEEFCRRLSAQKIGPELIAGFHHDQTAAGFVKGSESALQAAFEAFAKKPA